MITKRIILHAMSAFRPIAQCLMVKLLIFINFYLKDEASFKGEVQMGG